MRIINRAILISLSIITITCRLGFSQSEWLEAQGNIRTDTLTFSKDILDTGGFPATPVEGQLFFNYSGTPQLYYYNGSEWKSMGRGGPKEIGTIIVAASDTPLKSERADYVCSGTNDQNTINAAIAACTVGGAVYLLEGTYNISGPIQLISSTLDKGKSIIGAGKGITKIVLKRVLNNNAAVKITNVDHITIKELSIVYEVGCAATMAGIWLEADDSLIKNVRISGFEVGILLGRSGQALRNTIVNNEILPYYQSYGISNIFYADTVAGNVRNNIISNNIIDGIYSPIALYFSNAAAFENNIISENIITNCAGILISNGENNIVSGNISAGGAITITGYNNIIRNNILENCASGISTYVSYGSSVNHYDNISHNLLKQVNSPIRGTGGSELISGNIIHDSESGSGILSYDLNFCALNNMFTNYGNLSAIECQPYLYNISNYIADNFIYGAGYQNKMESYWSQIRQEDGASLQTNLYCMSLLPKKFKPANLPFTPETDLNSYFNFFSTKTGNTNLTLINGKRPGDLLIISNACPVLRTLTIDEATNANCNLGCSPYPCKRVLGPGDAIELIWNGQKWLELQYSNN
jgi:hypothetical protein